MTTPNDIIKLALKKSGVIGVGQTPLAEDVNDAFTDINFMLGQWARKRWLVYHLLDIYAQSTGALSYTVGPGQTFDVARPDRLEAAFFRQNVQSQPSKIDYPLTLIQAREEYNTISLKTLSTFPQYVFYDSAFPIGNLYVWPVPTSQYEIHITVKDTLAAFTSLTQSISLPPEYFEALVYNLAGRLRPSYQLPPDPTITALAQASLATIKNANVQLPILKMPAGITRPGLYNVYSDQVY